MSPRHQYREDNRKLWDECEDHLDHIIDLTKTVQAGERILLVGPNASGKSLFRKLVRKPLDLVMVHASMELRTGNFAHMGALSNMMADHREDATSYSTVRNIEGAIRSADAYVADGQTVGLHIDEPEIGYGEELQAGTGVWLRKKLDSMAKQPSVTIVTTHSRLVARAFDDWRFIDLGFEYKTAAAWRHRRIKALDPESILERGRCLFLVIVERQEANKKSTP